MRAGPGPPRRLGLRVGLELLGVPGCRPQRSGSDCEGPMLSDQWEPTLVCRRLPSPRFTHHLHSALHAGIPDFAGTCLLAFVLASLGARVQSGMKLAVAHWLTASFTLQQRQLPDLILGLFDIVPVLLRDGAACAPDVRVRLSKPLFCV